MEITELKKRVIEAFIARESGNNDVMSDKEYDKLLAKIEAEDPTFNINNFLPLEDGVEEAEHPIELSELDKSYVDEAELDAILNGEPIYSEEEGHEDEIVGREEVDPSIKMTPKYDGSSVVAYYTDGNLNYVLTKGDGAVGRVKTETLGKLFPATVSKSIFAIRGEFLVDSRLAGNSRAKANGLINSKEKTDEIFKLGTIAVFEVIDLDGESMSFDSPEVQALTPIYFDGINQPKFFVTPEMKDFDIVSKGVLKAKDFDFETRFDGVVCEQFDEESGEMVKWANKYDFIDSVETTIVDIEIEGTSKEGYSHVLVVKPVEIDDKVLERVYTGGAANMLEEGYFIGQKVIVAFSGSTIPTIVSKVTELPKDEETGAWLPDEEGHTFSLGKCPDCGTEFTEEYIVRGIAKCPNPDCEAKLQIRKDAAIDLVTAYGIDGIQISDDEVKQLPVEDGKYVYKELFDNVDIREEFFLTMLNLSNFNPEKKRQLPAEEYIDELIEACKLGNYTEVVNEPGIDEAELNSAMEDYESLKNRMDKLHRQLTLETTGVPTAVDLFGSAFKVSDQVLLDFELRIKATYEVYNELVEGKIEVPVVEEEVEEEEEEAEMTEEEIKAEIERLNAKLKKKE